MNATDKYVLGIIKEEVFKNKGESLESYIEIVCNGCYEVMYIIDKKDLDDKVESIENCPYCGKSLEIYDLILREG